MTTNRFHKAAKDGLIDVLKEATKRECNAKDEQGMTPTLYAAFHGHLEALRMLCGRGGDPDKSDHFGNTALHLAAAQGHKVVVTFLCNFGANIYAMDIDQRTAQDLAGMNNREEILRYMDSFTGKLEATDKKKAKSMKEKAKKYAEKRIKEFSKRQAKADHNEKLIKKQNSKEYKPSLVSTLRMKMKSGSMSNLSNGGGQTMSRNSFSAIVAGGTVSRNVNSTVQRKVLASKLKNNNDDDDFKISEIEDGKRSVRHIQGLRRDSEVLYGGVLEDTRRGRLDGVFNEAESVLSPNQSNGGGGTLTRSISQPDFMHELEQNEPMHHQPVESSSIFVRPGIGSLAFRKSITNTLQAMSFAEAAVEESSIGSARFDDDNSESESEEEEENSAMERFLTAWGLSEYLPRFDEQKIDLDTLLMLTESDLKTLNLPLGPHRKLVNAIAERKAALENPREVTDGKL